MYQDHDGLIKGQDAKGKTFVMKQTGVKYDAGKSRVDLLPCSAILEMGKVMEFGATKYQAHNWRKGLAWSRCAAAAIRHIYKWLAGEDIDPESGCSHLAHAGVNICFLIEFDKTHRNLDDRYKDKQ